MSLFRNEDLNKELHEFGYVKVPMLNQTVVDSLKKEYLHSTEESFTGFHPTMFHKDSVYREKINSLIIDALLKPFSYFSRAEYRLLYGNFMVKEPGSSSKMKLHQDWTYIDENLHNSYAIWIPLLDLNINNGAFSVIPKSHRINNMVRGPGVTCPFEGHEQELIENFGRSLMLNAGEAVIWDHRLAHYSPPNLSDAKRIAITAIVVPRNTTIIHYFKDPSTNETYEFHVDEGFFMNYTIGKIPQLSKSRMFAESKLTLNMKDFQNLLS